MGCIHVPPECTKMKKPHVLPIIELIREPLVEHISIPAGAYMFDAPRPAKEGLKISHEASKWFSRFFDRQKIDKVFHELRHTWIEAARISPIKKESTTSSAAMPRRPCPTATGELSPLS